MTRSALLLRPFRSLLAIVVLAQMAQAQFETRGSAVAQQDPYAIAAGDFNHDGKLDLAVATGGTDAENIAILMGRGGGSFSPPVYYTAGFGSVSIAAADFNHDGNLDLAVASQSGYIAILMGNGDGTFQPTTQSPPVPTFEAFVTVGDFNGDGKPDLLALGGGAINVLMGNGDGTFQSAVTTEPSFSVQAIGVGDFNGDGKLDLATAGEFGLQRYVNILLGNGDGTFTQGATYTGETSPSSIAVADFNGDHKLDFAVANYLSSTISVWLGNGDGTFQPAVDYTAPFPLWVVADRLTGDGKLDLVAANSGGGVNVFAGNGDGTFQPGAFYPEGLEDKFVAVGDFNGDRKPDIVIADGGTNHVTVLLNTGVVSFSPTTPLNFKKQAVGTTSAGQMVTLTNTGTSELKIQSMKASAEFAVTSTCGSRVGPSANCKISATFSPTKQGAQTGTITIIDNASSKPQVIELLGTGT